MSSRQAASPSKILSFLGRDVHLYRCTVVHTLSEHHKILESGFACLEGINLKIFSQNILFLCMEQYIWGYGVIRKYGTLGMVSSEGSYLNRSYITDITIIFISEKNNFIFIVFYPPKTQFLFLAQF